MPSITQWLIGKGINLSEKAVRDFFDIPSPQAVLELEIGINQSMLQILMQSFYSEALQHLRDGRNAVAAEKLVSAINHTELNLPAHLLYCHLLGFERQYDRALEEAWEILEKFGPREDFATLLPQGLVEQFLDYYEHVEIECSSFRLSRSQHYLTEIWCAPTGLLCKWRFKPWNPIQIERLWTPSETVEARTWSGKLLFEAKNISIAGMTNRYAILAARSGLHAIYRLKDGKLIPRPLYPADVDIIFAAVPRNPWRRFALLKDWTGAVLQNTVENYKNVVLDEERYDRSTGDSIYSLHIDFGSELNVHRIQTASSSHD